MPLGFRTQPRAWLRMVCGMIVLLPLGCARSLAPLVLPGVSTVALTGGPSRSMVYLARTSEGVIAIDLGWWGSRHAMVAALGELGASAGDVTDVFLTHSHRDHIAAWPMVRRSRFHLTEAERPVLVGERRHRALIPRLAEWLKPSGLPKPNEVDVRTFSGDTAFVFGEDTLYAFQVPGHTAGSIAYLFRGVLFLGDAATYGHLRGFGPARRGYSDDARLAATNLETLWSRLPVGSVGDVCTAHAHCRRYSDAFLADVRNGKPRLQ